ncbi:MAG: hypothetical protein HGA93_02595 [Methanothrix sp.]|nr:hypothetical protein [Methanothrix sp.]
MGRVLYYRGAWQDAEQEIEIAEKVFDKKQTNFVSVVRAYHALRFLLMTREQIIRNQKFLPKLRTEV